MGDAQFDYICRRVAALFSLAYEHRVIASVAQAVRPMDAGEQAVRPMDAGELRAHLALEAVRWYLAEHPGRPAPSEEG